MERNQERKRSIIGLCADCRFAERIHTARGSEFVLCDRSASDPSYARYPRLPVERCTGYQPAGERKG